MSEPAVGAVRARAAPEREPPPSELVGNPRERYGDRFQDHLLEQYKLYVDSSQRVSEKRISTGNYLLTVNSSLLTAFGIASTLHIPGAWLLIIPAAGLLVSLAWFSLVTSYKNLNAAKFKVIHELEDYLPAALFRHEWHVCGQGQGKVYRPITHIERWIPLAFVAVYIALSAYVLLSRPPERKVDAQSTSLIRTADASTKSPPTAASPAPQSAGPPAKAETAYAHLNWQLAVAAAVAVFTVASYFADRRRERAWRRTEFLCEQSRYLDTDPVLVEAVTILEGRHAELTVSSIFDSDSDIDRIKREEYRQRFDRLLNLLWRLCYAYLETKTISLTELDGFGWYLWRISESPPLVEYCQNNGFEEINIAIGKLKPLWT